MNDLEEYIDKSQVQRKAAVTEYIIKEKIDATEAAFNRAISVYQSFLPSTTLQANISMEEKKENQNSNANSVILDPKTSSLWAAGKEFSRGSQLSDRLGKNEKTKVICKLQCAGSKLPPAREPLVTEEERKAMMAYYFKRQEELKKLAEACEDDYLNSAWADPRGLKLSLHDLSDVKAPRG